MQFAFFARQPILNLNKEVYAYALDFRDGKNGALPHYDESKQKAIQKRFKALSLNDISADKKSFVEFSDNNLLDELQGFKELSSLVVYLNEEQAKRDDILQGCAALKKQGALIALYKTSIQELSPLALTLIDIIAISAIRPCGLNNIDELTISLQLWRSQDISLMAVKVDTLDNFELFSKHSFKLFQGYFFTQLKHNEEELLPASSIIVLQLLQACNQTVFDIDELSSVLNKDPSLSYALLKFINNPLINKRTEITSIKHALTYLGEIEVKRFVAIIAITSLNVNKPEELLHVSLVRAKFIELLLGEKDVGLSTLSGFMFGLLSLLDVILEKPMHEILKQVALCDSIKQGLLKEREDFTKLLRLVKGFESAIWSNIIDYSKQSLISQTRLHELFNESVLWANELNKISSMHFPKTRVS